MKKYVFSLLVIVTLVVSCKINDEPQYTPRFMFSSFVAWHTDSIQTHDTLRVTELNDRYVVDTVSVGDTVRFAMLCNAVTNQLTSLGIQADTSLLAMTIYLEGDVQKAVDTSSVAANGLLNFKPGYSAISFPLQYVAKRSGSSDISFVLSSTSEFSPATIVLRQPVR